MSKRKPAHEVIVEMIDEIIKSLLEELNVSDSSGWESEAKEGLLILLNKEQVATLLEALRRMIIPEDKMKEVVIKIRQIKATLSPENAEILFPEKNIRKIVPLN
jgi:hypothetical protein